VASVFLFGEVVEVFFRDFPTWISGNLRSGVRFVGLGGAQASAETEEEPLFVQRRLLILEGGERLFIWHPTQT